MTGFLVPFSLSVRCESTVQLQRLPHTDSFCLILPPNLKSAISAVNYMAEQLKKQDTDDTVRQREKHRSVAVLLMCFTGSCVPECFWVCSMQMTGDWQFIALVVDRLFLWLFVVITTLGTLAMFLDASFNYIPDDPFP